MDVKQSSAEINSALALQVWPAAYPPGQHFQSPWQPRSKQMHWRWGMLSMRLNVDNKQGLPSAGKSWGYPKLFISIHTHTLIKANVKNSFPKWEMSILCRRSQTKPFLINNRWETLQLLFFHWVHVQNRQGGAVATYAIRNPYPIGSGNCFLFYML